VVAVEGGTRLKEWLAVRNELEPDDPLLLEQLLARRAAEPERRELLATVGEKVAGVGSVGPKGSPPDLAYGYIGALHAWKQHGVEAALLAELRAIARSLGGHAWSCGPARTTAARSSSSRSTAFTRSCARADWHWTSPTQPAVEKSCA